MNIQTRSDNIKKMQEKLDTFYLSKDEPTRSTLLTLKNLINSLDNNISHSLKYGMPFFCYKGKMFCYLWTDKKTNNPYIGFVEGNRMSHPKLEQGNRSRMKIFNVNPRTDVDIITITMLLNKALDFYKNGIIKI